MLEKTSFEVLEKQITDERSRLSTDRMDISFGEIINLYKSSELIIRPEYQRLFRWDNKQKTALIESILLGIPIPPIFVAEDENGIWELVDGLQRISTVISFFGELKDDLIYTDVEIDNDYSSLNSWTLESGSLISDLEGFTADTLPKKFVINIKRSVCRVEILRGESNTGMKFELFKRLNSGGSTLTPQEIRNAIYRGIDPKVNNLTEELSKLDAFTNLVVLTESKKQTFYDQELVLRFLAFVNNIETINSNTEDFLDHFMEVAVNDPEFDIAYYKNLFTRVVSLLDRNCDPNVFRNDHNAFVPAYYEGITIGIAQNIDYYESHTDAINPAIEKLKCDEDFKRYSGTASNSKNRIKNRLKRANELFSVN